MFEFNNTKPSKRDERNQIIYKLFHSIGENAGIESPFNCDYGYIIMIGDNFNTNTNCTILDCAKVTIGDNVWICGSVTIVPRVTIGDNTIIGAGSVGEKTNLQMLLPQVSMESYQTYHRKRYYGIEDVKFCYF